MTKLIKMTMKNLLRIKKESNLKSIGAFTLVELLVVMAIISLLASLVLSSLAGARMKANDTKIAEDLRQVRKSIEIYYNDNNSFPNPEISSVDNHNIDVLAFDSSSGGWSNKLTFFVKTAEAQSAVHSTPLCANFDRVANQLVSKKYLSSRPVHPYDNDASGICYKAKRTLSSFVAYGILNARVNTNDGARSKRTGFIAGDTSPDGIRSVNNAVSSSSAAVALDEEFERGYPAGESVGDEFLFDEFGDIDSIDAIDGITSGDPSISDDGFFGFIDDIVTEIFMTPSYYLPHGTCTSETSCVCDSYYEFVQNGLQGTINGTCQSNMPPPPSI